MKYRIHLTAGPNGLPFSDTRQRADAALLLCETLARNVVRANAGLDTARGNVIIQKVRDLDPSRGGSVIIYDRLLILTPSRS